MLVTGNRNICPTGWHVPSDAEWTTLDTYMGGSSIAGGKMKEAGTAHWASLKTGVGNSSGFSGLPGGNRDGNRAYFNIDSVGFFWSATAGSVTGVLFY